MSIPVRVTAKDDGGTVEFSVNRDPINVPVGNGAQDIVFTLVDQTNNGPTVFNTKDPIDYAVNTHCPGSEKNSDQLQVGGCSDSQLTVNNVATSKCTIGYKLNFLYGNTPKSFDPIIING
jgi:hypothetical protein